MYKTEAAALRDKGAAASVVKPHRKREEEMIRRTIQSMALMLALSISAFAGEMQFPVTSPPPPPTSATQEVQAADDNDTPDEKPDGLTETILSVIESVLALL